MVYAATTVYIGIDDLESFGIDARTGRQLSKFSCKYAGTSPAVILGDDAILQSGPLTRVQLRTGKTVWKKEEGYGDVPLIRDRLVAMTQTDLVGRDVASGNIVWH